METDIHYKLDELKRVQQQLLRLLERLAGKKDLQDDWLDSVTICEILNVKDRTILRWRKLGLLKPVILGGKCYYARKDIDKLREGRQ